MFIQHLRMPKMDADAMKKALVWELRGKLPIDPSHAQLRHVVAGDVYEGQEAKSEVVVMAASKDTVNALLATAARAKLDIIGMNTEPKALLDCFTQIYRRKGDDTAINCFVDVGCVATRAIIARGGDILFARVIPVGGDHFSRATAAALKIKFEDAKLLRAQLAQSQYASSDESKERTAPPPPVAAVEEPSVDNSFALACRRDGSGSPQVISSPNRSHKRLRASWRARLRKWSLACHEPLKRIVEELELCRRYYESTFPSSPVSRLIFVGGEARQKSMCQQIAQNRWMPLAAQIGDPMVRIGKNSEVTAEQGLDCKQPQPGWAVAVGLSMGARVGATVGANASK